jgi:hypothetical protein
VMIMAIVMISCGSIGGMLLGGLVLGLHASLSSGTLLGSSCALLLATLSSGLSGVLGLVSSGLLGVEVLLLLLLGLSLLGD